MADPRPLRLVHAGQRLLLRVGHLAAIAARRPSSPDVVVGVEEVASLLHHFGEALPASVTVCLRKPPYYDYAYDHDLTWSRLGRLALGPLLLGWLALRHEVFIYIGGEGFLAGGDGREHEFQFLRSRGRRIVCVFTGSEIRSQKLMDEYGRLHGRDVVTTYQKVSAPGIDSPQQEDRRRLLAAAADRHAHAIVNPPVDQVSYLTSPTHPFLYFVDDEQVRLRPEKWSNVARLVLLHAPSSPLIKGTPLVRAAVTALREEGYEFDYVELIGVPHARVMDELSRAHIVLNEFYSLVPGVFGVEAMAANAVLVTSADPAAEPSLPDGSAEAWVVTPAWRVLDRLRVLLDHPEALRQQADRGTEWVAAHATASASAKILRALIS